MTVTPYIGLGFVLFTIGLFGVLTRRNTVGILMAIELMLNASNIVLVAFSRMHGNLGGQLFAFFTITVTVAEVAVGLAIVVQVFRLKKTINADEITMLKG